MCAIACFMCASLFVVVCYIYIQLLNRVCVRVCFVVGCCMACVFCVFVMCVLVLCLVSLCGTFVIYCEKLHSLLFMI